MTSLLRVECVAKSFGGRRVLSSASLRGVSGEVRALFGRNGTGKSTLLKIAAGRITPDGGSVHFGDRAYLAATLPDLAAEGMFYLPQRDLLSSGFTVRQQLAFVHAQFGGAAIDDVATQLGIRARLDQRPNTLSGGERRRADLAAVLLRRPTCLLADEPYRGLAPYDAELLTRVLRELAAAGTAVIVTGHDVATLLAAADHVTWCTSGTTYELGPPSIATQHAAFRREYLDAGISTRA